MLNATLSVENTKSSTLVRFVGSTLFLSAFLLFWSEPMVGKMVLPYAGGAAAVWATCVLFFQLVLLTAYLYAHLLGRFDSFKAQFMVHAVILVAALAFLPIQFGTGLPQGSEHPALWLLLRLLSGVGAPFFAVATTAPLLQKWFSMTAEQSARDPYFLYAASNGGSLLALAIHPFVMEPALGISVQAQSWSFGYFVLIAMIGIAAFAVSRGGGSLGARKMPPKRSSHPETRTRLYWVVAAFLPSALMLAVTNHISTNVTSAPFVWVVPLATYLLTFILAFANRFRISWQQVSDVVPFVLVTMLFVPVISGLITFPGIVWLVMGIHIALLFFSALLCHAALAHRRPDAEHLTEFYFLIALGGVLGGAFTAIAAPALFQTVFEYPLLIATVAFFRHAAKRAEPNDHTGWAVPAVMGIIAVLASITLRSFDLSYHDGAFDAAAILFTIAVYQLRNWPRRFAIACAALILTHAVVLPNYFETAERLYIGRNFFGIKSVLQDRQTQLRRLTHGDTLHGMEYVSGPHSGEPLAYYHRTGPVGDVMSTLAGKDGQRLAIIGLGTGSMAAYAASGRSMTFFEIDPDMEVIARRFFTYLNRCGTNCEVIVGDGRLELARIPAEYFNFLMLDAFSSDAIPAHLVSREALQLYLSRLTPDGILLFHVSNRFLDIARLTAALIADAGLVGIIKYDFADEHESEGKSNSIHIAAARRREHLGALPLFAGWEPVTPPERFRVWTDDYSNLLGIIRMR